jgi:GntR family transcriptional regulator of vanillate catabolism
VTTAQLLQEIYRQISADQGPETATLTSEATSRIRQLVLDGELEPNARINEVQLGERLAISRTPMRAALQTLAGEGLLIYAANRGFTVRAYDLSEIIDAYEVRIFAEGLAARLAAERGVGDVERVKMQRALECGERILKYDISPDDRQRAYGVINSAFHGAIHRAPATQLIVDVVSICRIPQVSARKILPLTFDEIKRRQEMHERIFRAILCREARQAESLMREHVADVKETMVLALNGHRKPDMESQDAAPIVPRG